MTLNLSPARSGLRAFRWAPCPSSTRARPSNVREPEAGWWRAQPEPARPLEYAPALTVVVLGEPETRWGIGAVVSRVADLAVGDELLVVYESEQLHDPGKCPVVSRLRDYLPRHHVIAVPIAREHVYPQDAGLVEYFLENGSLPVVVTPPSVGHEIAAELTSLLQADRVVRVARTIDGVDVCQVWTRTAAADA